MPEVSEIVQQRIGSGYLEAHGNQAFIQLGEALKRKKTDKILAYFRTSFFQAPITWVMVKDTLWQDDTQRARNKFHFLQGDIVQTKMTQSLGQSQSSQTHDLWMVLSPSCDVTPDNAYIRVAKVIRVDVADTAANSAGYEDFQKLVYGAKCSSPKYFPLPPFPSAGVDTYGYYVDLITPYSIAESDAPLAIVKHSLRFEAWHLLNIFLMQQGTRSNPEDEPKIRCLAEGIPVPSLSRLQMRVYIGDETTEYRILSEHYSEADHSPHLADNDEFVGRWFQMPESQKAYWFMKRGLAVDAIVLRDSATDS